MSTSHDDTSQLVVPGNSEADRVPLNPGTLNTCTGKLSHPYTKYKLTKCEIFKEWFNVQEERVQKGLEKGNNWLTCRTINHLGLATDFLSLELTRSFTNISQHSFKHVQQEN